MPIESRVSRRRFLQVTGGLSVQTGWMGAFAAQSAPIRPSHKVDLFSGRDLAGWYSWLAPTQFEDPLKVFTVRNGLLRVSGEVPGYLATTQEYRDYRLIVEYKWGDLTYGATTVRNSGLLLHATGTDGNHTPWMASVECQIAQGCVGDFIVIQSEDGKIPVKISSDTVLASDGKTRWKRGGKPTPFSGKQFWWSKHEPGFEEKIDTRGRDDLDSPLGEWTRLECVCLGDRITVLVNGTEVNECYHVSPSAGKILLESEGFEILFRRIELQPA